MNKHVNQYLYYEDYEVEYLRHPPTQTCSYLPREQIVSKL